MQTLLHFYQCKILNAERFLVTEYFYTVKYVNTYSYYHIIHFFFQMGGIPMQDPFRKWRNVVFIPGREVGKALNCVNNCFNDTFGFQLLFNMAVGYVKSFFSKLGQQWK